MNYQPNIPQTGFVAPHWVKQRYSIGNSTIYAWIFRNIVPRPYWVGPQAVRFRVEDLSEFKQKFVTTGREG